MKKTVIKIFVGIFAILILGLFIRPQKVVYEAKISGFVMDENGKPLKNATVSRIEKKRWKNKEFGYHESSDYKSQKVQTDENGKYNIAKDRIF